MNVRDRMFYWMEKKNIKSVNELSLRAEMTQSTLQNIVTFPERQPRAITIKNICKGLGITVSEFWGDINRENKTDDNCFREVCLREAEVMHKTENEKAALERLKAMPLDEQQRRIFDGYNKLSPEQKTAIDIIIRSLSSH